MRARALCLLILSHQAFVADCAKKKKKKGGHDIAADVAWLEEKSKEEGVTKLESGLMYKVLKSGKAWAKSPYVRILLSTLPCALPR